MNYLSQRPIAIGPDERVVISVVRNEMLRLPYWLSYYRGLGFDRFLIVDNGSTDGTPQYLLGQEDTFLFSTEGNFGATGFGMAWVNYLLDQHCVGRWIALLDVDELLVWPGEQSGIDAFVNRLDREGAEALFTIMVDMYSDRPFGSIGYVSGEPFLPYSPFFDPGPYNVVGSKLFPYRFIFGGVRERVAIGLTTARPPSVSKAPLVRWRAGQQFALVAHALAQPMKLAPMRGALLHFKMFDDLPEKCRIEPTRGEHFAGGQEYATLGLAIARANGSFYLPGLSEKYTGPDQLVALNVMDANAPY